MEATYPPSIHHRLSEKGSLASLSFAFASSRSLLLSVKPLLVDLVFYILPEQAFDKDMVAQD